MKYTCECGAYYFRQTCEAAGHTWAVEPDASKTVDPTCYSIGYEYYPCAYCDAEDERELEMIPHVFATEPDADKTVPAKCGETGMEYYPCTYDGCEAYDEKVLEALEHNWVEVERTQNDCTQEGLITYECLNACGTPKTETLPMEHAYVVFGGTVSKADDPRGIGYELWACPGCDEAKKIAPNDESGHFFTDNACACGAKLVGAKVVLLSNDFETANNLSLSLGGVSNAEWVVSTLNQQIGLWNTVSPLLVDLLSGNYERNGEKVNNLAFAFDMKYSLAEGKKVGDLINKNDTFISWRSNGGTNQEMNLNLNAKGEKLTIYLQGTSNEFVLEPDVNYTLALNFDIAKIVGGDCSVSKRIQQSYRVHKDRRRLLERLQKYRTL